jgi:hypothetical protein
LISLYGGAVSNLIIEIVMFTGLLGFVSKIIKIKFDLVNFLKVVIASGIMVFFVNLLALNIFLIIIIGVLIYFFASIVLGIIRKQDVKDLKAIFFKN